MSVYIVGVRSFHTAHPGLCDAPFYPCPPSSLKHPLPPPGPGALGGFLFFGVASLAATSMVAMFLAGMYATAATGLYGVAKVAHQQRLEQAAQAQRIRQGGQRQGGHYE